MTEEQTAASGAPEKPSGSDQNQQAQDSVKYETYKKVLSEKKRAAEQLSSAMAKIQEFESAQKEKAETDLKEQNRWKELYESASGENKALKETVHEKDQRWESAVKIDAFYKGLGDKKIESKYSGFIDTTKILVDPESGEIDQMSVQREVERVSSAYPEIIKSSHAKPLPSQAPAGSSGIKQPHDMSKDEKFGEIFQHVQRSLGH